MDVHLEELIPSEKLVVEKFLSTSGLCPFWHGPHLHELLREGVCAKLDEKAILACDACVHVDIDLSFPRENQCERKKTNPAETISFDHNIWRVY